MARQPVRRGQVVSPFGVGALVVMPDGTSMVGAGLDKWFMDEDDPTREIDSTEFQVEEWRLQGVLDVDHFRLPPDHRDGSGYSNVPNPGLTIPYLRFPRWHFCPRCGWLTERPLSERGRPRCARCEERGGRSQLVQVRFIAMCEYGHLQDFPWREWVHREAHPTCTRSMRLVTTGSATLAGQRVTCDCGVAPRPLSGITTASTDGTETDLSTTLAADGTVFLCRGLVPWHGQLTGAGCDKPLRGTLRSASNLYFANTPSAIYLPRGGDEAPGSLVALLEEVPLGPLRGLLRQVGEPCTPSALKGQHPELLQGFTDEQIRAAIKIVDGEGATAAPAPAGADDDAETAFRRPEFAVLRRPRGDDQLSIRDTPLDDYDSDIRQWFSRIMLIDRLRETRALAGFNRVFAEQDHDLDDRLGLLWAAPPPRHKRWLPAAMVFGEGIFLEFDESRLERWEGQDRVMRRARTMYERFEVVREARRLPDRAISPRLVMMHTFAHLLINRLTFDCGYGSSSLRERLYVSPSRLAPMAGILIYTASGDSEGSMGGLVRMGKPGYLEPAIRESLQDAEWCSADPVCMEAGEHGGQGPDSCNLSACHNCAVLPETACEEFNRFLDRGMIVGTVTAPEAGFFASSGFG